MKEVDIISKVVGRTGTGAVGVPSVGGIPSVDLSGYLLKKVWDEAFELKETTDGTPYLYGKLPVVVRYGITMYGEGGDVDIPSIYAGLPIDNQTLYWENGVLKAKGGTEGAITDITSSMVVSALGYTPAKASDLTTLQSTVNDFLSGSDTDSIINKWKELEAFLSGLSESDNLATILENKANKATTLEGYGITDAYTKSAVDTLLGNYVTLGTAQTITGEKDFTGGLKVNGSPIVYDATNKYWKLEGDLLVTGGVTMFASDSAFTPSTIMNAIATDGTNLKVVNGVLTFVGSIDGGEAGSVHWENVEGKPSFASVATSGKYSDLSGAPTLLSSFTNDVGFITSYIDTKNTAGSTNTSSKIFLIGATSQAANPQTYSHDTAYVGTDGYLYSGGAKVLTSHQTIYNLTMQAGAFRAVTFDPNGANKTVNIPTTTSHITEGDNLYYTNARAQAAITGGASTIVTSNLTANRALISNASGKVAVSAVTSTELGYLDGVTSAIQTQLNSKLAATSYTAADVLAKLLTVDGASSGLDADLLDGTHKSGLLTAASSSSATNLSITVGGTTKKITDLYAYKTTQLETARTIWGQSFDGTQNVSGALSGATTGAFSSNVTVGGIFGVTGATTLESTLSVASDTTLATKLTLNGIPIYKSQDDVLYIDGNLAVRGGITMYATDAIDVPSIIDALPIASTSEKGLASFDPNFFSVDTNGNVSFIGSTGGVDESVLADYAKKTDLSAYLPLGGGIISNDGFGLILNRESNNPAWLQFRTQSLSVGAIGAQNGNPIWMDKSSNQYTILHSGNWSQYVTAGDGGNYLSLSGGTLTGLLTIQSDSSYIAYKNGAGTYLGDIGFALGGKPCVWQLGSGWNPIITGHWTRFDRYVNASASIDSGTCSIMVGTSKAGLTGYNSGVGFSALSGYGRVDNPYAEGLYINHLHAWIGLSSVINNAGAELYDLVFATNNSTTANASPTERMRITNDGSVKIQKLFFGNTNEINSLDEVLGINYEGNGKTLIGNNGHSTVVGRWSGATSNQVNALEGATLSVFGTILGYNYGKSGSGAAFILDKPGANYTGIGSDNNTDTIYFGACDLSGNWVSYSQIWKFGGDILTNGGITMYSDIRKKTKLQDVELSLKQIADAPLIEHYYNSDSNKTTHVGSIAQYWAELNNWFCKLDNEGFYTMEIQNAALASAISIARELVKYESKTDRTIRKLKKRISELEDEIEKLKSA